MKPVGQAVPHESANAHVSGQARYTGDLPEPKNLLIAWPVQSPHAHARILRLETAHAMDVPGVVAVLTKDDVPGENNVGPVRHDEPLFPDVIEYHGQAVCWVLAESDAAARAGAAKIIVEYEVLEPVLNLEQAISEKHYHIDALRFSRGNAGVAFEQAYSTLEGRFDIGGQDHFYLETHASLALFDEEGQFLVHASTQHPSETQAVVARVLGVTRNRVTVQSLRMGGGFGGKETQANPFAAVAALGVLKTGRPVRVRLNRHQDMQLTGKRHPFHAHYKVGFDPDGTLLSLEVELYADGGWSLDLSEAVLLRACVHVDNAYYIPNVDVTGRVCKTNKTSNTAFRGFGGPQGILVIEEIMDRVARTLKLRPDEVRERNFYRANTDGSLGDSSTTHYGQVIKDNRIHRLWHELKISAHFEARHRELEHINQQHPYKRRGLAITPVKFGISFNTIFLNQAGALVHIFEDGSVQVNHGGTEMGQGLHTKIRQIAAQTLGVKLEAVRVTPTRTDKVPNTSATAASSGTDLNGAAVKNACETLRSRLAPIAAQILSMPQPQPDSDAEQSLSRGSGAAISPPNAEDLMFEDGSVYALGAPDHRVEFRAVIDAAYHARVSLSSTGFYRTPEIYFDKAKGKGAPFRYFSYGAAISEVEVDGLTGEWHLRRVDILHDVGDSLNPLIDLGQIEGGFIQGMGWLTFEELHWDDTGRLRTFAPSTYKIPTLADVPLEFHARLAPRDPEPGVVYGGKAVGEPPLMLAISVREALKDAIASFGGQDAGVIDLLCPATPEAILWAVEKVQAKGKAKEDAIPAD
jgi:xanthine dehydrogenase large subunit